MQLLDDGVDKKVLKLPQRLFRWTGGLIFVLGMILFYQMALSYEIRCAVKTPGTASQCEIVRHFYHLYSSKVLIGDINAAIVKQTGTSSKNNTPLYAILLLTNNGPVNLTGTQSSCYEDKAQAAKDINLYIRQGVVPHHKVPFDTPPVLLGIILILPLIGIVMMFARNVTVIFDKSAREVIILKKNRWMETKLVYPMAQVDKVVVQEYENTKGGRSYRLALLNHDQTHVPFTRTYSPSLLDKKAVADNLNHFIADVPRSEPTPSSQPMPTLERIHS